jgi:hypothetical protein
MKKLPGVLKKGSEVAAVFRQAQYRRFMESAATHTNNTTESIPAAILQMFITPAPNNRFTSAE